MKKKLLFLAATLLLLGTSSLTAVEFWIVLGDWSYKTNEDGGITIGGYRGLSREVVIPDTIADKPVTIIADDAFKDTSITSVVMPDSITEIGNNAFNNCSSLASVTMPDQLVTIGDAAFNNCTQLTSISIPNGVTSIGESVFESCIRLSAVNIPGSLSFINDRAFANCISLDSISIPNTVNKIGNYSFSGCDGLTSVTIPESVTIMYSYVFFDCPNLTTATFLGDVPPIFGRYVFDGAAPSFSIRYYLGKRGWTTPIWWGYQTVIIAPNLEPLPPQNEDIDPGTSPNIWPNPVSQSVNLYQSVTFSIGVTGSSPLRYQWFKNNAELSGATQTSYTIASANQNDAGEYYCRVSNNVGTVYSEPATLTVISYTKAPLYRFSRNDNPSHFFTAIEEEKNIVLRELSDILTLEGVSHYVVESQQYNAVPVYRMYNNLSGAHFYTASEEEKNTVLATLDYFSLEGVAFYVFLWPEQGTLPVYRFYVPETGSHFFTISEAEKNVLVNSGQQTMVYEGIAWYAFPTL